MSGPLEDPWKLGVRPWDEKFGFGLGNFGDGVHEGDEPGSHARVAQALGSLSVTWTGGLAGVYPRSGTAGRCFKSKYGCR